MRRHKLLGTLVLAVLLTFFLPCPAHAYIDPGTTGSVISGSAWAVIAPFLAMGVAFLGLMIRPVRMFFASLITKLLGGSRAEPIENDEQPAVTDLPEGGGNGEDTSGDLRS